MMRGMDVGTTGAGAETRFRVGTGATIVDTTVGMIAGGIAGQETITGGVNQTAAAGIAGTMTAVGATALADGATTGHEMFAGGATNPLGHNLKVF